MVRACVPQAGACSRNAAEVCRIAACQPHSSYCVCGLNTDSTFHDVVFSSGGM